MKWRTQHPPSPPPPSGPAFQPPTAHQDGCQDKTHVSPLNSPLIQPQPHLHQSIDTAGYASNHSHTTVTNETRPRIEISSNEMNSSCCWQEARVFSQSAVGGRRRR